MSEAPAEETAEPALARLWEPEPEPLGVLFDPTGHPEVDAALERLAELDGVPVTAHAAVYENVQQTLSSTLTTLDDS
ncbi:hypothetical protein [Kitasatospora sp. NBC_01266]|uniref:hypothetical protein n=1 Tax=Kitasatospora sp. NBC_01266 TaxID=2903572 RepID=UPI002E300759|nr:hypothetical protein [Kitasatospora sp. NBC_01266]